MMSFNWLAQIFTVTIMNLRNISQRLGTSSVAIFGVACVVGVFIGVLSMATGFQRTMTNSVAPDMVMIMRAGSASEMSSGLSYEQTQLIDNMPGIQKDGDTSLASAELLVIVSIPKKANNAMANASLRGVQPAAFKVRDKFKIVEGRNFESGKNELIVGRGASKQFNNVAVGSVIRFGNTEWHVVGVFEEGGGLSESEVWCDAKILQAAYRRGNSYQTIHAKVEGKKGFEDLKAAIAADPKLTLDVVYETAYLAEQSSGLTTFIKVVGYPLAIIMAIGAIFGAINTMYTSVASRTREIATLRALGFGAFPVAFSTLVESLVLAFIGGAIGAAVIYLLFNGYTVSTLNFSSFSQVVFDFAVTPALLKQGVIFAAAIGFIGGLFPAIRAARLPVATALRDNG
ncbi:membrane protein [Cellvibrio zantedeschiae]|uniref:Membrane protein n=1 Tax=Cellvibrio zantedeschiae TaxID=1237077 RepID=A0ABQ3AQR7_9GAMM|nr:ABC transporter permease [Cellvibrio zantedeschiae]GGY61134.1 membrane protein [Cellvibrio zantedeschiae]